VANATAGTMLTLLVRPFVLFLLLHLTGGYGIRWAVCAVPALRVGVTLWRQPAARDAGTPLRQRHG
jgi:hypothetical protein